MIMIKNDETFNIWKQLSNYDTIDSFRLWAQLNNEDFNSAEFSLIKTEHTAKDNIK